MDILTSFFDSYIQKRMVVVVFDRNAGKMFVYFVYMYMFFCNIIFFSVVKWFA